MENEQELDQTRSIVNFMGNFATNETDMKCFHIKTILVSHNNDMKIGLPIYKYKYIYIGYKLHYTIITSCENLLNNRMLFGNEAKYKDNDIADKINNPLTGYAFFFAMIATFIPRMNC